MRGANFASTSSIAIVHAEKTSVVTLISARWSNAVRISAKKFVAVSVS